MSKLSTESIHTQLQCKYSERVPRVRKLTVKKKNSNSKFQIDIEEANKSNFLSAGEMPLPELYFMMSLIFFLSGLFWVFLLKKST